MKMTNCQLAVAYINATQANDARNTKINEGLSLLCDGYPSIEPMIYELYEFYDQAMIQLMGEYNFEWCTWYLYESNDEGGKTITINRVIHTITSPEQFAELCIQEYD